MRAPIVYGLTILAILAPLAAAGETIPPSYIVTATHSYYGTGVGYLWGDPELGARLWLDLVGGHGTFGFSIGGRHTVQPTPAGDVVVDDWIRTGGNGPERFVASYAVDAHGIPTGIASGGGKLNQFVISVHGHT